MIYCLFRLPAKRWGKLKEVVSISFASFTTPASFFKSSVRGKCFSALLCCFLSPFSPSHSVHYVYAYVCTYSMEVSSPVSLAEQ